MLDALRAKYEAQYKEAEVTLKVYANNPVAIGEHPQHIEEMDKLVSAMAMHKTILISSTRFMTINKCWLTNHKKCDIFT